MKKTNFIFLAITILLFTSNIVLAAFCVKCGDKLNDEVKFCPKCGHQVGAPLDTKEKPKPQPKPVPVYENIEEANAYFDLAQKEQDSVGAFILPHVKRRRYEKALDLYLKILEKWPNSDKCEASAYHAAEIYESKAYNDYNKAIQYYRMVLDINPETTMPARLRIAVITEYYIRDFEGAVILYEDTIANARVQDEKEKAAKELKSLREKIERSKEKIEQ